MSKFLLTGVAGFIGSNLALELVKQGYNIIGIDNLSTGYFGNIRSELFKDMPGTFKFIKKDINAEDLYLDFIGVDVVLHLAALAKVQFSTDFPLESNYANITGTLNVLEAARKAKTKRVVFSSSSSVYGGANIFPTPEDAQLMPRSNYALQKFVGEKYCKLYSELYGLDTACLRYHNVIGINSRLGGAYSALMPTLMNAAANGGSIIINGSGSIERDYTPVQNVIQANILAAQYPGRLNGECFNVALGETYSINYVYNKICEMSGVQIPKTHGPQKKEDPIKSLADILKAKEILGYNPVVSLDESLKQTWEWWKNGCKNIKE